MRMACATTVALLGAVPKANAFASAGSLARTAPAVAKRSSVGLSAALRRYWSMSTETGAGTRKSQVAYLRSLTGSSAMSSSGDPKTVAAASAPGVSLDSTGPKRVLVPIADGSEEIESVTIIDTLVRAGASVTVASVGEDVQVKIPVAARSFLLCRSVGVTRALSSAVGSSSPPASCIIRHVKRGATGI